MKILIFLAFVAIVVAQTPESTSKAPFTTSKTPYEFGRKTSAPDTSDNSSISYGFNCTFEFNSFTFKYNKKYANRTIEFYRKGVFCQTLKMVNEHNANASSPFKLSINQDSDLEPTKNPRSNGLKLDDASVASTLKSNKVKQMPPLTNVKKVGAGTYANYASLTGPVKDQGFCGGCWSFAATSVLQYAAYKKLNQSLIFSEQEMIVSHTKINIMFKNLNQKTRIAIGIMEDVKVQHLLWVSSIQKRAAQPFNRLMAIE